MLNYLIDKFYAVKDKNSIKFKNKINGEKNYIEVEYYFVHDNYEDIRPYFTAITAFKNARLIYIEKDPPKNLDYTIEDGKIIVNPIDDFTKQIINFIFENWESL